MTVRQIDLRGDGVQLRADVAGPADGLPVLLVHGGGQTRGSWGRALERLAARGARAYAIDMRGHGESEWAPDGAYQPSDFAADLVHVVPALGPGPVALIGASMGGWAALLAAPTLGDALSRLVLVDIVPRLRMDGAERVLEFMRSAPNGFADTDEAADAVAAYLPHRPRPQMSSGLRRNLRRRADGRLVWHWDPLLVRMGDGDMTLRQQQLEAAARRTQVPMLLVRGLLSDVVDDDGVAALRALVPHLQVVDLPAAAHTAAVDDNDLFTAAVIDFVPGLS